MPDSTSPPASSSSSGFGAIVGVVVVILIGIFLWNQVVVPGWEKYVVKYDKPWWNGNESMRVCEAFGDESCYSLVVGSTGEEIVSIYFPSGGYLYADDWECAKAAEGLYDYDRFCRMWDSEGRKWDILPF
ncbi:MAG: hypothetical protein ACKVOG_08705 [Rhodoglobus sp.]|jgi:hypothetical protein